MGNYALSGLPPVGVVPYVGNCGGCFLEVLTLVRGYCAETPMRAGRLLSVCTRL